MKRVVVLLAILLFTLGTFPIGVDYNVHSENLNTNRLHVQENTQLSDVSNSGDDGTAIAFMSRTINSQSLMILNSYSSPSQHTGSLDLSQYLIPGWDLYEVDIESISITAVAERESFNLNHNNYIRTENSSGLIRDALYQAFYNQPHDGKLDNYSFSYLAFPYDDSLGEAFLVIRSNYSDSNTNITGYITPFNQVYAYTRVTHDVISDNAILDASTFYYAVIDGTGMEGGYIDGWKFNTIYWQAQYPLLGLKTGYHLRSGVWDEYDSGEMREAELDYTYTPWNKTSDAPLTYSNPTSIALRGNLSSLGGLTWTFTGTNVSYLTFDSNQSVEISYNVKMSYKKQTTTASLWSASVSGQDMNWNVTTEIEYPKVSEERYLNYSIPTSRTITGLYNNSIPSASHGNYETLNGIVRCSNMGNDTWTLTAISRNFLTSLQTYDNSDDSVIASEVRMDVDIEINSTILEEDSDPVVTGIANLTIYHSGSQAWNPSTQSVTSGETYFFWDISATVTSNGLYTIEEFWSNGTEAGYRTKDIVLYYPTTLTPAQNQIDGYTDDSIDISVDFDDILTPRGLDSGYANVMYSFDGAANVSCVDQSGGTWTATVPTTGKNPGSHSIVVYGVGYGLENQSAMIDVDLIHDTEPLDIVWSNTNNISYVEFTELSVGYNRVGSIPIPNALVEVTIGTTTWQLDWNGGTETYNIIFNGTDIDPGFGSHILTIEASRVGYESQSNDTVALDVHEEYTIFGVSWTGSTNITYIESVTLYVDYQMSNTTAIPSAIVEVTIDIDVYFMNWNSTSGRYWYQFNGDDTLPGFGVHYLTIEASKFGYHYQNDTTQILTIDKEPTTLVLSWTNGNNITYVNSTTLIANFTQSDGSPVTSAIVNVTAGTGFWKMRWNPLTFVYELTFNGTDTIPGFGIHDVTVLAGKIGFVNRSNSTLNITILLESTSTDISWSNTNSITYIEQTTLVVSYWMSNGTPITGATINVTISGTRWNLTWHDPSETYRVTFNGSDVLPGFGTHDLSIRIEKYGYENPGPISETLIISKVLTNYEISWSNTNSITYVESTILSVNYTMIDGSPVIGATINATIGGFPWTLDWDEGSKTYQVELMGSDILLGLGNHSLIIRIGKFGYINYVISNETLLITEEPTTLVLSWPAGNSITYVNSTILIANFTQSDGSPVTGAIVNVTAGTGFWLMKWNPLAFVYELKFNGTDTPPGFGMFEVIVLAGGIGYIDRNKSTTLIVDLETTSVIISWSNTNDITYLDQTTLIISYRMSNNSVIPIDAIVNVTIGGSLWNLTWDDGTDTYRVSFYGFDLPSVDTHDLLIQVGKYGYENYVNSTIKLTIHEEPTNMIIGWFFSTSITYLESTILDVNYQIVRDLSPVTNATVIVIIDSIPYQLVWHPGFHTYRYIFNGTDELPGLGFHSLTISANKTGFEPGFDDGESLNISDEPTSLIVQWANGINNPEFFSYTYLIAEYTYGGSSPVLDAILNVTINSHTFRMEWNASGFYQMRINGSDTYLGTGTKSILVSAGKFGYAEKIDTDAEIIIPVVPTKLTLQWTSTDTITYVEYTTLQAYYVMYNDSSLYGASVNVTINGIVLPMIWSSSSNSYERTFYGYDSSLGLATFSILVEAFMDDFQSLSNSSETLTINPEPTALVISWIGGDNITYFQQTTLSVQFIMSNATPISTGVLNATIGGVLFHLSWNSTSHAYEVVIYGDDDRLDYLDYDVVVNASAYGYVSEIDTYQYFTIRLEDTYIAFDWVPSNTISYLDTTTFRIYYRYSSNHSPVLGADVRATYLSTWVANYNSGSGAYEIVFTGSDFLTPIPGTHALDVVASKANHQSQTNDLEEITVIKEGTNIDSWWLDGDNTITFVENTTIYINYSIAASGISILDANVTIRIGTTTWDTLYNSTLKLYTFTFTGDMDPPGLGVHGLFISASYSLHEGYEDAEDNTQILEIESASVEIHSYWIVSSTITYLQQTTLVVNYTLVDGEAIPLALVNVTIGQIFWYAQWDEVSETYRLTFNGSDSLPGLGFHELNIRANRTGFDTLTDSSISLNIIDEPTVLIPRWSDPNQNSITYFEYTYLFVDYLLVNTTPITYASVNVTIDTVTWVLVWNSTEGAYGLRINGSDTELAFGINSLTITALKHGYEYRLKTTESLELSKDPTSIQITWLNGDNITYIESTTLVVHYRMSNSNPITDGTITATIGTDVWLLVWNETNQGYYVIFEGDASLPGLGSFSILIQATGTVYATQTTSENLIIREEQTTANASWTTAAIDWTQSIILGINYQDSHGSLLSDATQKIITIDGVEYPLSGTNGTYWFSFDNSLGLGLHHVIVNISKYGYEFAVNTSISFEIIKASTDLGIIWSTTNIDYLGQITLTANYTYSGTGDSIPVGLASVNITIDGITTLNLTPSGNLWTITLNRDYLDLGTHSVVIIAHAYGYNYAEISDSLTVTEVSTTTSGISWTPSSLVIEYTNSLTLMVDYTYAGGDVPDTAIVNVTVGGHFYELEYISGAWWVNIPGSDLGVGIFNSSVSAWLYGYELQTFTTMGINVTLAANSFYVTWEPSNLTPTYIDTVRLTVVYTQDFDPIEGATVQLFINGTGYFLTYSEVDERWFFSIEASDIDLGVWNVTVTANKTGYADGFQTDLLTVIVAPTLLDIQDTGDILYSDEITTLDIYYQLTNSSVIPGASISFTLDSVEQTITWSGDHWTATLSGTELGVGVFNYTIILSAYGYETQQNTIVITVLSVPTSIISDSDIVMYARDSVSFRFTYIDDRTSTPIEASDLDIIWSEFHSLVILPNYTYVFTIGGNNFHIGNYTFQLTLLRVGFDNCTGLIEIQANPIPIEIIFEPTYTQYENETLHIDFQLMDTAHSSSIDWGYVMVELEGVGYLAIYNSTTSSYIVNFRLPLNIDSGTYALYFHSITEDCIENSMLSSLEVLEKHTYMLSIDVVDQIQAGNSLSISITAREGSGFVSGINLDVTIVITLSDGGPQIIVEVIVTNSNGLATIIFEVPTNAVELEISASFDGSISEWPTESSVMVVKVTPAGTGSSGPIISDPLILTIVTGGISIPLIGLALRRRKRGGPMVSAPVASTPVIQTSPPSTPATGIQQRLREEILNNDEGNTRAELSRRFGISSSKIGTMVKDLLDSDSGFYEVKIGPKKLIKFRKDSME